MKQDRYRIALHQSYEIDYAVAKLKKQGYNVSRKDIRNASKALNDTHSRRRINKYIKKNYPQTGQQDGGQTEEQNNEYTDDAA